MDAKTRVVILGSLPGEASLAARQYYAHPQNQFWRLVGAVAGVDLATLPYADRLTALLSARIGIWDVVASAHRAGSLDTAIRDHEANDLRTLLTGRPALRAVGFNGKTAAKVGRAALGPDAPWALIDLPSSSPAHAAMTFEAKRTAWLALNAFL